jgi:hypothetical protein
MGSFRRSLLLEPNNAAYHFSMGTVLQVCNRMYHAFSCCTLQHRTQQPTIASITPLPATSRCSFQLIILNRRTRVASPRPSTTCGAPLASTRPPPTPTTTSGRSCGLRAVHLLSTPLRSVASPFLRRALPPRLALTDSERRRDGGAAQGAERAPGGAQGAARGGAAGPGRDDVPAQPRVCGRRRRPA